jgi:hypothetical protein
MEMPLLTVGFMNALYFGGYAAAMKIIHANKSFTAADYQPKYSEMAVASAFGGLVQWTLACPIDVIKIKLQVQTGRLSVK